MFCSFIGPENWSGNKLQPSCVFSNFALALIETFRFKEKSDYKNKIFLTSRSAIASSNVKIWRENVIAIVTLLRV